MTTEMKMLTLKKLGSLTTATAATMSLSISFYAGSALAQEPRGVVYTMTNSPSGNKVLMYKRDNTGRLGAPQEFATGGTGTGGSLGNQNAVILDKANSCLYVVNPASNNISSFIVKPDTLVLADKVSSGGARPVSVTTRENLLYVLNAGGSTGQRDNISGFTVNRDCKMLPIASSTRSLSAANTAPAQVQFTPDGKWLVVTEKATNKIDTYSVLVNGRTVGPRVQNSAGVTPFGFAFGKRDQLYVSEAAAGGPDGGTVSSYKIKENGDLQVITSSLPTTETATCWVAVSNDGRFAYVTNTGSQSISALKAGFFGDLSLLTPGGRSGVTPGGSGVIDLSLSNDGLNLYALDNVLGTITVFGVNPVTGAIPRFQVVSGLPVGSNGLAVR
jgi:6-phosphogluconolactonase (cycloisomerase 2 family)